MRNCERWRDSSGIWTDYSNTFYISSSWFVFSCCIFALYSNTFYISLYLKMAKSNVSKYHMIIAVFTDFTFWYAFLCSKLSIQLDWSARLGSTLMQHLCHQKFVCAIVMNMLLAWEKQIKSSWYSQQNFLHLKSFGINFCTKIGNFGILMRPVGLCLNSTSSILLVAWPYLCCTHASCSVAHRSCE